MRLKVEQVIEVLAQHQKWRRGEHDNATDPTLLGKAIDVLVHKLPDIITGNARYEKLRKLTPAKFDGQYNGQTKVTPDGVVR
jgi:hypothetical protein